MAKTTLRITNMAALMLLVAPAGATDLTLHLAGNDPVKRNTARFQCDAQGARMGLPAGIFSVEYINGAGNHLAVVPVKGSSMIFVTVPSGSGAKYAAEQWTWWDAGTRGTTFGSDFPGPKATSSCHQVK
ncbi:MliC family protein [Edaphobacter sp. HDX4]|uniref:MliC family protein n=1 Tax=Edaphobacter sp. HDX4 TaxID=2794064 RepID=UPI002FE50C0C